MMHHVLIIGAGKIGSLIAFLLANSKNYDVYLADIHPDNPQIKRLQQVNTIHYVQLDAANEAALSAFIKKNHIQAVISSLPFYCNPTIAKIAAQENIHYFDLTEDVETTKTVEHYAQNARSTFVPQCGLAPGFISII